MSETATTRERSPSVSLEHPHDNTLLLRCQGEWRVQHRLPARGETLAALSANGLRSVSFETQGLRAWDSAFVTFIMKVRGICAEGEIEFDSRGLPEGVRRLVAMADAVPDANARVEPAIPSYLARIGLAAIHALQQAVSMLAFGGECVIALGRLVVGKARFRGTDLISVAYASGAQALGIVALISFLLGSILAFIGALELKKFGAELFVADLVGVGMAREMAPMMTAIVMAGRTGAAFAARLGTMTVNEEIDALRTLGIRPMEFLVLPRVLALGVMMPLLTLYAMAIGILGGGLVAKLFLGIPFALFIDQLTGALHMTDVAVGLTKGAVFGVLVALAGCWRGMQSGRSAAAVGAAATSAVVSSIVLIIATDAMFSVILNLMGV